MKVLVDMNLSPRWARFLGDAGIEARHWSELGPGNAPDVEIMAFARVHDYVVHPRPRFQRYPRGDAW